MRRHELGLKKLKHTSPYFTVKMNYNLRCLSSAYKPRSRELFASTWPKIPLTDFDISWKDRSKDCSYAVLDEHGKFIGFIIASFHTSSKENLYIDYLALALECRGSGLGSMLMKHMVSNAFRNKSSIHLYPENSSLVPWYSRNGFYSTRDGYYNFHSYSTRRQSVVHEALKL